MFTDIAFPGSGSVSGTGGGTIPSTGFSTSPTSPPISSDVLESASVAASTAISTNQVILPAPSIVSYMMVESSATDKNTQTQYNEQQYDDVKLKNFYNANIITATELIKVFEELTAVAPAISSVFGDEKSNESTLNGDISTTNTGLIKNDNNEIDTMNQAIKDYNAGNIPKSTYFDDVATYNAYVNGNSRASAASTINTQINTYNGNVTTENSSISGINTQFTNLDLGFKPLSNKMNYDQAVGSLPALSTTVPATNPIDN